MRESACAQARFNLQSRGAARDCVRSNLIVFTRGLSRITLTIPNAASQSYAYVRVRSRISVKFRRRVRISVCTYSPIFYSMYRRGALTDKLGSSPVLFSEMTIHRGNIHVHNSAH